MDAPGLSFKVKFANGEPDIIVEAQAEATFASLVVQIREQRGWTNAQNIRLICAGKEMYPEDLASRASAAVLHCIATEGPPPRVSPPKKPYQDVAGGIEHPPVDWLDVVDPGTVLMWIFGSILALLWLLFVFYAHMFDKTSLVMLCMMTIAFLIPCVLSYMPWVPLVQRQAQPTTPVQHASIYDPAIGRSTAVSMQMWDRQAMYANIPPRPLAPVRVDS